MINFQYDIAAPVPTMPTNIAELMASQGVKTDGGDTPNIDVPDIKTNQPAAAGPVAQSDSVPTPTPEGPPAAQAATPVTPKADSPKEASVPADWKELLKKQPETEVLKHLGFDDKVQGFLQKWKAGEDLKTYFEALTTDYAKMSAEDVMKRQLQLENPDMEPEDFEEYFRMKVIEHFKLDRDLFSEQEVKRGRILLNAEAKKVRENLIKDQSQFLLPKAPEKTETKEQVDQEAERAQIAQDYKNIMQGDPYTIDVLKNKSISIGEGEDKFNYSTESPEKLLNLLYDSQAWASKLYNEDGTPNVRKQLLMAAIVDDEVTFFKELKKHFAMQGAKSVAEPMENASMPVGLHTKGNPEIKNPAEALARGGVIVSG